MPASHPGTNLGVTVSQRQLRLRAAIALLVVTGLGLIVSPMTAQATPPPFAAECPSVLRCIVVPAAYTAIDGNVEDYGNYDIANRPSDMVINSIVVHDGEGTCEEIVDAFRNPRHYASTQYVICRNGTVYQMVRNQDLPWHAGNWWYNMHSIGIEHEGHAAFGGTDYTPAMYSASALLVKYLTARFNIPRDRTHIIGHDNVPGARANQLAAMHTDPGPFWNWQLYMLLITGKLPVPSFSLTADRIMVAPVWPLSKTPVTGCSVGDNGCVPTGLQPTNFVYLRTEPRADAPLFSDPTLGQGSTEIANNAARLFYGQTFMVADRRIDSGGVWYKVWVNGSTGWFHSPWTAPTSALPPAGEYVTPKAGLTSIPLYGRPSPETTAYPAALLGSPPASFWIPMLAPTGPLPYQVTAGQRYAVLDAEVINDHFYAWASDSSFPYDHTVFRGSIRFIQIQFGNRIMFVKATDVDIR